MSEHIGRSFDGHPLEDACPCPQEPCGLIDVSRIDPTCGQHALAAGKTIRQSHTAERCPVTAPTSPKPTTPANPTGDFPPDLIEKAARALWAYRFRDDDTSDWDSLPMSHQESYRVQSSAVLAVLPAPPVVDEGWTVADWEEWASEVAATLPEDYDGDEAQIEIIARFVRTAAARPVVDEPALRERIAQEIEAEQQRARAAHQAANVDHFAHDYCRWVGHAEALGNAARIARGEGR